MQDLLQPIPSAHPSTCLVLWPPAARGCPAPQSCGPTPRHLPPCALPFLLTVAAQMDEAHSPKCPAGSDHLWVGPGTKLPGHTSGHWWLRWTHPLVSSNPQVCVHGSTAATMRAVVGVLGQCLQLGKELPVPWRWSRRRALSIPPTQVVPCCSARESASPGQGGGQDPGLLIPGQPPIFLWSHPGPRLRQGPACGPLPGVLDYPEQGEPCGGRVSGTWATLCLRGRVLAGRGVHHETG